MRRLSKVILDGTTNAIGGRFNHTIAAGLAVHETKSLVPLLDSILRSAFSDPTLQMVYTGYERVYPEEAASEIHNASASQGYDISASDLYTVKFLFKYGEKLDKDFERYRWIPFVRPGNLTTLGGSSFLVRPVVTDKIISPGSENTFLRLLRTKLSISKMNYACNVNEHRLLDMSVPLVRIYNTIPKDRQYSCKSTVILYMLGYYGLDALLTALALPELKPIPVSAVADYPTHQYAVYTTGKQGSGVTGMGSESLAFVTPLAGRTKLLDQFMCNLFYLLDNLPMIEKELNAPGIWQRLLGAILHGVKADLWLSVNMRRHYDALMTDYMPPIMIKFIRMDFGDTLGKDLGQGGFFKLLAVTFRNFDLWMSLANEISASAYDKRLSVNYFLLYDTITRINTITWELTEQLSHNRLNESTILKCLRKHFTLRGMFRMTEKDNISVQSVSHHTSNYTFKLSTAASLQLNTGGATGAKKKGAKNPVDATTLLHESHLLMGTLGGISAARMSPLSMLNVYAPLDEVSMTMIPSQTDLMHLESIREVLSKTPHRSKAGALPIEFNRYVHLQPPGKPPEDW